MGKRSTYRRIDKRNEKMLKKTLSALALVTAFSAVAEPILLPGGVVVNNPAVPDNSNGLGNVNSSLEFIQWFEVTNPDDASQSAIVGLDQVNSTTYGSLFGTSSTATFGFDDLSLFGGLGVDTANGGFNLDGSFVNIYVSDLASDFD